MCFGILTGIDYLHPDLASNYVSIHNAVFYTNGKPNKIIISKLVQIQEQYFFPF